MRTHVHYPSRVTKYLLWVFIMAMTATLCGCSIFQPKTVVAKCRHIVVAQYLAAVEVYGEDACEIVVATHESGNRHAWLEITIDGQKHYVDNYWIELPLWKSNPRAGEWKVDERGKPSDLSFGALDKMPTRLDTEMWHDKTRPTLIKKGVPPTPGR